MPYGQLEQYDLDRLRHDLEGKLDDLRYTVERKQDDLAGELRHLRERFDAWIQEVKNMASSEE